jgi:hypothetical protein
MRSVQSGGMKFSDMFLCCLKGQVTPLQPTTTPTHQPSNIHHNLTWEDPIEEFGGSRQCSSTISTNFVLLDFHPIHDTYDIKANEERLLNWLCKKNAELHQVLNSMFETPRSNAATTFPKPRFGKLLLDLSERISPEMNELKLKLYTLAIKYYCTPELQCKIFAFARHKPREIMMYTDLYNKVLPSEPKTQCNISNIKNWMIGNAEKMLEVIKTYEKDSEPYDHNLKSVLQRTVNLTIEQANVYTVIEKLDELYKSFVNTNTEIEKRVQSLKTANTNAAETELNDFIAKQRAGLQAELRQALPNASRKLLDKTSAFNKAIEDKRSKLLKQQIIAANTQRDEDPILRLLRKDYVKTYLSFIDYVNKSIPSLKLEVPSILDSTEVDNLKSILTDFRDNLIDNLTLDEQNQLIIMSVLSGAIFDLEMNFDGDDTVLAALEEVVDVNGSRQFWSDMSIFLQKLEGGKFRCAVQFTPHLNYFSKHGSDGKPIIIPNTASPPAVTPIDNAALTLFDDGFLQNCVSIRAWKDIDSSESITATMSELLKIVLLQAEIINGYNVDCYGIKCNDFSDPKQHAYVRSSINFDTYNNLKSYNIACRNGDFRFVQVKTGNATPNEGWAILYKHQQPQPASAEEQPITLSDFIGETWKSFVKRSIRMNNSIQYAYESPAKDLSAYVYLNVNKNHFKNMDKLGFIGTFPYSYEAPLKELSLSGGGSKCKSTKPKHTSRRTNKPKESSDYPIRSY